MNYVSVVDTYLNELKALYRVDSDEALAGRLEVGKSTLATWRRRGSIPREIYSERLHPDPLDYFLVIRRHLAKVLSSSEAGTKMLVQAAIRLGAEGYGARDAASWADWLVSHRLFLFEETVKLDEVGRSGERVAEEYVHERLMGLALNGNSGVFAPDMLRKLRNDIEG